jgi:hypothetical protein
MSRSAALILLLIVIVLANAGLASAQQFISAPRYPLAMDVGDIATEDFNGDGKLDLAFATTGGFNIIELGNGDGTFTTGQQLPGNAAEAIVAGDWNNDGIPDLATADFNNSATIYLGNGDGTFTKLASYTIPDSPHAVAAGDLNGDGVADLVVVHLDLTAPGIDVLIGLGGGAFANPVAYNAPVTGTGVAMADLNGDGKLDVIASGFIGVGMGAMNVLLGNGDGTLQPAMQFTAPGDFESLAVGDFNHDGIPDVATVGQHTLQVFLGKGDGTLITGTSQFLPSFETMSLRAADVTGDGNLDLLAANLYDNSISVFPGKGDGTFRSAFLYGTGPTISIATGDFNGDGALDAVAPTANGFGGNHYDVLLGDGSGKFIARRDFDLATGTQTLLKPKSVAVGFLDSDNFPDLAIADEDNNQVIALRGVGDGTFLAPRDLSVGNGAPITVAIADLNKDGKADIASANNGGSMSVLLGNGNGTFQPHVDYQALTNPTVIRTADVTGDGNIDVIVSFNTGHAVRVFVNDGTGKFPTHFDTTVSNGATTIALGDFNKDGKLDFAATSNGSGIAVFLGNGDGTFTAGQSISNGFADSVAIAAGDLNGDGKTDLVVGGNINFTIFPGNGDGTFGAGSSTKPGMYVEALLLGDLNRDGKLDVVVIGRDSQEITSKAALLLGNGDGTLQSPQKYDVVEVAVAGALGDFNRDGALDVAAVGQDTPAVSILLNTGAH